MRTNLDKILADCDILCYHRVLPDNKFKEDFPSDGLSLSVSDFENQIIQFKKRFNLIDLNDSATFSTNRKRNLLLTFDDGYIDLKENVLPLIEKFNVPIVVFITTGSIDDPNTYFWWIDLWYSLNEISEIKLIVNEKEIFFSLKTHELKMKCYKYLSTILINYPREKQVEFFFRNNIKMDHLKDFLSSNDLKILNSHRLVTLGFHSHYHLNYGVESAAVISEDINKMLAVLEKYSIIPKIKLFAFCYGIYSPSIFKDKYSLIFNHYFSLGYRALFERSVIPLSSRIIVDSRDSTLDLYLRMKLFSTAKKIIYFIKKCFAI
jgi:hypothetical protein